MNEMTSREKRSSESSISVRSWLNFFCLHVTVYSKQKKPVMFFQKPVYRFAASCIGPADREIVAGAS